MQDMDKNYDNWLTQVNVLTLDLDLYEIGDDYWRAAYDDGLTPEDVREDLQR